MDRDKDSDYRKGYQAGFKSGLRADSSYVTGRNQGKADVRQQVIEHINGKRVVPWLEKLLFVQMAKMPATRQPIDNEKFAQIEANFFNRRNTSLHTPIRL